MSISWYHANLSVASQNDKKMPFESRKILNVSIIARLRVSFYIAFSKSSLLYNRVLVPSIRSCNDIYCFKAPKSEAIFSPVCTVPVRFAVNINKTTLSTTLNTILFSTGHITQQQ